MDPRDLTLLLALVAGVVSFISPCVLPLVPAYLGQLAAIAAVNGDPRTGRARGVVLASAAAYVLGFGAVFTLLGVTATYLLGPLAQALPGLRQAGGLLLVVMGLAIAGILPIPLFLHSWRPLDAVAATALAGSGAGSGGTTGMPLPRRAGAARGLATSFALGTVFAIGWTPCIGPILGSILTVAATQATVPQGGLLLVAYSLGLGVPFMTLALLFERAPRLVRPITRHGGTVALVGGLLVTAMGVAIFFDVLVTLNRYFFFGI